MSFLRRSDGQRYSKGNLLPFIIIFFFFFFFWGGGGGGGGVGGGVCLFVLLTLIRTDV